jgi:ATP-dependent DNA helicase RecG
VGARLSSLPIQLDDLIQARTVEGIRLEFKATWDDMIKQSATETICAFANDLLNLNGGYVILGIETDAEGHPVLPPRGLGNMDLDRVQREIRGQCERIDPKYQPALFVEHYHDRPILVIWAPGGDTRPYQAPKSLKGGERAYFVRLGSETVEAKGDILRQLLEQTARVPFDDRRNLVARIEDISPTLVRRFLSEVRSELVLGGETIDDRELYRRMNLVVRSNGHEIPRNVALLFFHETPERFFPGARIEVVRFADGAGGDLLEERVMRGPLPEQIRAAIEQVKSATGEQVVKIQGRAEADRIVAYPFEAIEEGIVNAVYHRSYEEGEPTKVYLYPDRLEITSYPGPVGGITKENLAPGRPTPQAPARNRRVGELLKELRLAEKRGTGLPKIRRAMRNNGSPEPEFDFDEARTYFRTTLRPHPSYRVLEALGEAGRLWALGDRNAARQRLSEAFETQPGSGTLAAQLIEYAIAMDDLAGAVSVYGGFRLAPTRSDEWQPYLTYAGALLRLGLQDSALRVLNEAPDSWPPEKLFDAAGLRMQAGDFQTAHQLLAKLAPTRMDDPRFLQEFAEAKINLASQPAWGDARVRSLLQEAEALLRRAISLSPDQQRATECWLDLANVLTRLRRPASEIEAAYQKAGRK